MSRYHCNSNPEWAELYIYCDFCDRKIYIGEIAYRTEHGTLCLGCLEDCLEGLDDGEKLEFIAMAFKVSSYDVDNIQNEDDEI